MNKSIGMTAMLILGLLCEHIYAVDRYVWANSPSPGSPYTSWNTAAHDIQTAVNAAVSEDTVIVTDGVYNISSQISINTNITVKSVNGAGTTIVARNQAGSYRIFNISGTNIILDGFTITNGYISSYGGGIYLSGIGVTVRNCIVANNSATHPSYGGGGIYISGATTNGLIENCRIVNNTSFNIGGGLIWYSPTTILSNSVVGWNSATNIGGGMYVSGGQVINCTIIENTSTNIGGGLGIYSGAIVDRCLIVSNTAKDSGGFYASGSTLSNTIQNCLIYGNTSTGNYGGVSVYMTNLIRNCTIVYNTASNICGGITLGVGSRLDNCIIYFNTASSNANYSLNASYQSCNCTYPAMTGGGNITNDPQFADAASGNYRLSRWSPCKNTGTNQDWMTNAVDLDGQTRIWNRIVDMGAYEYWAPNGVIFRIP